MKDSNILKLVDKDEAIDLLQKMIGFRTVNEPGDELPLAKFIKQRLDEIGLESVVDDLGNNRGNVIGRLRGTGEREALLFNGHLDTVPPGDIQWDYDPYSGKVVDGKIYGRGSADMKGGLAAMFIALKAVKEAGWKLKGDFIYSATAGEEIDSIGAVKFVQDGGLDEVGAIIIGEPSAGKINIAEKGAFWVEITTYGKTAHGAFPQKGINAVTHMNALLSELISYRFKYEENSTLGHPTMNISTINGGVKTNVVPDKCSITIDMRTVPGMVHSEIAKDFERIIEKLATEIDDFKADIKILNDRAAVETKPNHPFVKLAEETIKEEFGREVKAQGVNFYTDASIFLPAKEIPCIFYGPGDSTMAHQPNEYITIDSLIESVHFYIAIIERYLVL
ncbi:succinyl-diaminopimelate desuccinylase [Tissierella praeacuta]|uniref:M20 family metallopeptidase n=1 Tax=Tissierella praeacuta TaxID=43131 RepID=UPI00105229C4|nr:M20 family metallopeptidase [Tissierella praeacuta]TCU75510.1 succinyl-diaminopimelate desuccinylase [Tissierella praeacuta]